MKTCHSVQLPSVVCENYYPSSGFSLTATGRFEAPAPSGGRTRDVQAEEIGDASAQLTAAVDDAYRTKYSSGAGSMVTATAVVTTLRLDPE